MEPCGSSYAGFRGAAPPARPAWQPQRSPIPIRPRDVRDRRDRRGAEVCSCDSGSSESGAGAAFAPAQALDPWAALDAQNEAATASCRRLPGDGRRMQPHLPLRPSRPLQSQRRQHVLQWTSVSTQALQGWASGCKDAAADDATEEDEQEREAETTSASISWDDLAEATVDTRPSPTSSGLGWETPKVTVRDVNERAGRLGFGTTPVRQMPAVGGGGAPKVGAVHGKPRLPARSPASAPAEPPKPRSMAPAAAAALARRKSKFAGA
mmetsp:Transcript_47695/g.138981  ORF Transcript_47695/g.138981 Transcript_47695/m.138981 type:complete len:266 (-) Transcript_47695:104-901(-)